MNPYMYIGLPLGSQLSYRNQEKPLQHLIEKEFKVPTGELFHKTRKQETVEGRHLYAAIMYHTYPSMSLSQIGGEMGKDHATVLHSCKKVALFLVLEPDYRQKVISVLTLYMRHKYPNMADWFVIKQTGALMRKLMVNESRQERARRRKEQSIITLPSRMSEVESA